jgi:hypothetical protein
MRKVSLLVIAMLVSAVALSIIPARGSTGNIYINKTTSPSPAVSVQAGQDVSLYFGGVTFSGGQVRLYFSRNGDSSLDLVNDKPYGPTFVVAHIRTAAWDNDTTYADYNVGNNWIVGAIPKEYAGGDWYIKGYDGSTAAVAVTDRPLTVTCLLEVTPTSGPGQADIVLHGYGFSPTAGNHANLSYWNSWAATPVRVSIITFVAIDINGQFIHPMIAPDALKALVAGNQTIASTAVVFRAQEKPSAPVYTEATFTEYKRGLIQVDGKRQKHPVSPGYLFGNLTDFSVAGSLQVNVSVLGTLIVAGQYMHPGPITLRWDGAAPIGTPMVNATGFFNITVSIPITTIGKHFIIIDDTKSKFNFSVNVIPTVVLSPNSGVPCTTLTVMAEGFGFRASTSTVKYHVTVTWLYLDWGTSEIGTLTTKLLVGTDGHWMFTFTLPHSHGGANTVKAVENDTAHTTVTATFTVQQGVKVTPSVFPNNGTVVTISGCGLKYNYWYDLLLDNTKDLYSASSSGGGVTYFKDSGYGDFSIDVIAVGFNEKAALHGVALYQLGDSNELPSLVAHTTFTVTSAADTAVMDKLTEISDAIDSLDTFVRSDSDEIHTLITAVQTAVSDAEDALASQITGLGTRLTSIETYAQTAATSAASASSAASAASTAASSAETAAEAASAATSTISTAVYGAIILSLVAALASIFAVITLQKKVA